MRRYQLSGLEHVHMMRHVPRSYDMTRTHILHRSVNRHVDVVLRCSPKNWRKKKVTVSVVSGEKNNEVARIRANARKGYVAVRKKEVNELFEADRKVAARAYAHEKKYGVKSPGSSALIHDMRSQLSAMAKKSADYIDDQLTSKPMEPVVSYTKPETPETPEKAPEEKQPLISQETEEILKKGGYRLPSSHSTGNPYAANYSMHASNEEFHHLMDSLEKSLDEACRKYAVEPVSPVSEKETQPETKQDTQPETGETGYTDYVGSYNKPNNISLSVTHKQEITAEAESEPEEAEKQDDSFRPALTFTEGGEHYEPQDDLFDRELNRPNEGYVPPAYFFDDDDKTQSEDDGGDYVPLPDPVPAPVETSPQPQEIFRIEKDGDRTEAPQMPEMPDGDYPHEDYVQQQIFFPSEQDAQNGGQLYNPPKEEDDFADPTLYSEQSQPEDDSNYDPPMVFPDHSDDDFTQPTAFPDEEDDIPMPMIFPDDGEEEEGYSPAPVSPDRNEYFDGNQGIFNRSGQTFFSRTGDRVKKVIGVIKGETRAKKQDAPMRNRNVEITFSDRDE